jgi:hypothetical protein
MPKIWQSLRRGADVMARKRAASRAWVTTRDAICLTTAALLTISVAVRAQGLNDGMEPGSAGGLKPPATVPHLTGEDTGIKRHTGPTGKVCIAVAGEPRPETANPKIFEHWIVAVNSCGQKITMQVCYYQAHHCVAMNVPPYGRDEVILGIMPSMSGFRFEFREQFDRL